MAADVRPAASHVDADSALVAPIREGDERAFEALYLAYHDALWRFAYAQVHSASVAEELVQDVFLALWRDRATWQVTSSVRAWLYGAVRHHALKHLRHERVVTRLADRVAVAEPAATPAEAVEAEDLDAVVRRALATLPERRRLAMTLRWTHDLPAPEIAAVLGTTPEAVRVLLTRARQELATLLRRLRG